MKKPLCSDFVIKFSLKLFFFHVIPFCLYFTTTEKSHFFEIWRPHGSVRLISKVVAWNGAFWQSCVFNIKKLDNSRKILEGNTKIPIKVALFDLLQMVSRIERNSEYLRQQSMRNIKISLKQKGAHIKFIFLVKKLGSKTNIYDGTILTDLSSWNDRIFFLNRNIWLAMMTESKAFMKHKGSLTKVTVIFLFKYFL